MLFPKIDSLLGLNRKLLKRFSSFPYDFVVYVGVAKGVIFMANAEPTARAVSVSERMIAGRDGIQRNMTRIPENGFLKMFWAKVRPR